MVRIRVVILLSLIPIATIVACTDDHTEVDAPPPTASAQPAPATAPGVVQDVICETTACAHTPPPCSLGTPPPIANRTVPSYHPAEDVGACGPAAPCNDPRASCKNHRCIVELKGDLWVPNGPGPFPVFILNHGSVKCLPGQTCLHNPLIYYKQVERYFFQHGYVVFAPSRRGYYPSTGMYIDDLITRQLNNGENCDINGETNCMTYDLVNESQDVIDAYNWIGQQPFVDKERIAVFGQSLGGIVTMFVGQVGFTTQHRVTIAMAPGAESWCSNSVLRDQLMFSADHQFFPTYTFDTLNDISIRPVTDLGFEMGVTGHIYQSGLFPKVIESVDGAPPDILTCGADAHACFAFDPEYVNRWAPTVLAFMNRWGV